MTHHYRLFGLTLATDRPLQSHLTSGEPPTDVTFTVIPEPPVGIDFHNVEPLYESPHRDPAGDALARLYRVGDVDVLRFVEGLDVYCRDKGLEAVLRRPDAAGLLEIRLLGPVLSYHLERAGLPVLHASAVVVDGRAVVFLAENKGGKSSLAAGCMQLGHALLTDDLLPVERASHEIHGRAGYPQMRFWPDAATRFWDGDAMNLPTVHPELDKRRLPVGDGAFGRFRTEPAPLAAIYLPFREDDPESTIRVESVSGAEALVELLRRSFIPRLAAAAGWEARRFDLLADLAEHVPVRRLRYPSGYDRLPAVVEQALANI